MSRLTTTRPMRDRIAGTLYTMAAGDALGAPHEFKPAQPTLNPTMSGGGGFGWEKGEWTDDSSMAIVIAKNALMNADLRKPAVQDKIVTGWVKWMHESKDVGIQTSKVLGASLDARTATKAARLLHERTGRSGGNGSLMRTAPVALRYLDDPDALVQAAREISSLTHYDPEAGDACVLWCLAIRYAILNGEFNIKTGIKYLPESRRGIWRERINEAETHDPAYFTKNGWSVQALQGAWSAIIRTPIAGPDHLRAALVAAVRGGNDTDTVAAIAGSLLGARWGASAVPLEWQRVLHGWPGLRGTDLMRLGTLIVTGDDPQDETGAGATWIDYTMYGDTGVRRVRHPHDEGVWLGGVDVLDVTTPDDVDAVVSLCRIGTDQRAYWVKPENHVEVWLLDEPDVTDNLNLDFVLKEAADAVAAFRDEGKTVLLHCVAAWSRTPTVATMYANRHLGIPMSDALEDVIDALGYANPNPEFRRAMDRLS